MQVSCQQRESERKTRQRRIRPHGESLCATLTPFRQLVAHRPLSLCVEMHDWIAHETPTRQVGERNNGSCRHPSLPRLKRRLPDRPCNAGCPVPFVRVKAISLSPFYSLAVCFAISSIRPAAANVRG